MPKATKVKKPETTGSPAEDPTVSKVLRDFNSAWDYCHGALHDRWMDNYKLYHGVRVNVGYDGITDTFVPMTFSTVETKKSALFSNKPKWGFMAPSTSPNQNTDILNSLVDFFWDKDQWGVKVADTGGDMLTLGNGVDYYAWDVDHPIMLNIPLRDFFIDPTCTWFSNARFAGRRFLSTVAELEEFEVIDLDNPIETENPETGAIEQSYQMRKKYTNLDKLKKAATAPKNGQGAGMETTDQQEKNMFYGSTLTKHDELVEVIEYWTLERTISIANRQVTIEDAENYFLAKAKANGQENPKGLIPFNSARGYVDPNLFHAKGEVDFIAGQQELLNDITNQNIDSITFALNQMYTIDPAFAEHKESIENIPGAVYPFPKDALVPIPTAQVPAEAFNERINIKSEIRETTATNEVTKGGDTPGSDPTATEVNAQVAGAGQRTKLQVSRLEQEYFHRMACIVFQIVRLYVTEPMMVRILGKDGASWELFDPAEFAEGDYEPRVQLEITIENKKKEEAASAKELMAAFMNDPTINQQELKKLALTKGFQLDPDEVQLLMQPQALDPMTGQPIDPNMMGGMQPPMGGQIPGNLPQMQPQGAPM